MAGINIDFPVVKQKTDELKKLIETELEGNTVAAYETALRYAGELQGAGAEAIQEAIAMEKENTLKLSHFMTEMLGFIQDSADAFEHVDVNHEEVISKFL